MTDVTLVPPGKPQAVLDVDTGAVPQQHEVIFDIPRPPAPRPPPPQPRQTPPQQQPPRPSPPQTFPPPEDELQDFANPQKVESPEEEFQEDDNEELYEDEDEGMEMPEMPDEYYHQSFQQQHVPMEPQPLPPFKTIEEERADLMYKIHRASKNGVQVRTFGWDTDIREIRSEAERVKMEQEVDASVALQRQILMTICTGLEYVNKRYDYLDLELDGWSESIMEDLPRYDLIFEKLHKKHAGKVSLPVELQLILMIGGSAMTYHMVNKGRKARFEEPKPRKKKSKKSKKRREPDYDSDDSDASERTRMRRKYSKPAPETTGKREMKGPAGMGGMDMGMMGGLAGLGGLGGGLGGLGSMAAMSMLPQMPMPSMSMPEMTRNAPPTATIDPIANDDDGGQEEPQDDLRTMEAPPPSPLDGDADDEDSGGDRLSDIPSEELNELMEANLDSMKSLSPIPEDTKVIELEEEPKGKKKRGRKKKEDPKNVVVI